MIRPLLTAILEYSLALIVLKKGKLYPQLFSLIIFLLASYQLGEFVQFATNGNQIGIQISYFATALLPPLGVLLAEKVTKRKFGYPIFQVAFSIFALMFLIFPSIIGRHELTTCCVRVIEYSTIWPRIWSYYYSVTISYTIAILLVHAFKQKKKEARSRLLYFAGAYSSFYFISLLIVFIYPDQKSSLTSIMCALAVISAIALAKISLSNNGSKKP